jgi:hypothetical protein
MALVPALGTLAISRFSSSPVSVPAAWFISSRRLGKRLESFLRTVLRIRVISLGNR